jgi:hypothetical protein
MTRTLLQSMSALSAREELAGARSKRREWPNPIEVAEQWRIALFATSTVAQRLGGRVQ